jgi:hypothetical protein
MRNGAVGLRGVSGLALIGSALAAVGSFGSWATVSTAPSSQVSLDVAIANGMDIDGGYTLLLAVVAAGLSGAYALAHRGQRMFAIASAACSMFIVVVALVDMADIAARFDTPKRAGLKLDVSVAYGLYVVLAGGILGLAGNIFLLARRPRSSDSVPG